MIVIIFIHPTSSFEGNYQIKMMIVLNATKLDLSIKNNERSAILIHFLPHQLQCMIHVILSFSEMHV